MEEPPEGENWIKQFLRVFKHATSPGSDEGVHHRVGYFGSYRLASEDLEGEVFDWVMHYLEQKKCPHSLAVVLSKALVEEVHCKADFSDLQTDDDCTASLECGKNLIDAGQLKSQVFNFLTELIQYWKDHYEQVASTTIWPRPPIHEVSVCAIKNARRKMEDRHMVLHDLNVACDLQNLPRHSYYAIFDGHAGTEAASFSAAHLHWEIVRHPAFLSDMPTAIKEAFKTTDRRLLERSFREGIKSGCTVVCCIIREKTLYLAWLGDSQAMVVRQGVPLSVTSPHKPDREDERQRIENAGGCILFIGTWRVNGTLAVSRALGDPEHKPYVSSVPDVIAVNLDGTEDFLILGCDGLWDRMTPSDVITSVFFYIKENPNDAENASSSLVHEAKDRGSNDNITAIVVFLRDPADLVNSPVPVPVIFPQLQGEPKIVYGSQVFGSDPTLSRCGPDDMKKLKSQNESQQSGIPLTNPIGTNRHGEIYRPFTMDVILERTELSELPTPPIDEIMNTKQFETYSQNLNETNMGVHHLNTSSLIQEQNILEHEPKAKTFYAKLPVGHAKIEKISTELVNSAIESAIQIVKNKEKDIITQLQNLQETETVKSVLLQEYINTEDSAICELDKFGLEQQKVQVEQTETCNALITSEIQELSLAFKSFKEKSVYTSRPGLESIGLAPTSQTETEHLLVTQGLITQVLPTLKPETKQQVFAQKDSLTQQTPDPSSKMEQLIFNVHDESAQPIAVPTRYQCDDLNTERTPSKTKQPTMLHGESTEPITSTSLETEYYQQSNLKQATAPPSETGLVAFLSCETESEQELVPPSRLGSQCGMSWQNKNRPHPPRLDSQCGMSRQNKNWPQPPRLDSQCGMSRQNKNRPQPPRLDSQCGMSRQNKNRPHPPRLDSQCGMSRQNKNRPHPPRLDL
ncbi:uncharacterized protein LOC143244218 [Tachypleus tridentatus]|uniref:uncharacterized protein LOC143244218 n=1 Tax=Tachypleus tridentatus TaxID=6853 RepID=UPI003FD16BDA